MVSVSRWNEYSRVVLLHTLHIVRIVTRLCSYLINYATLYPLLLTQPQSLPLKPLCYSYSISSSVSAAVVSVYLDPSIPMHAYYHH